MTSVALVGYKYPSWPRELIAQWFSSPSTDAEKVDSVGTGGSRSLNASADGQARRTRDRDVESVALFGSEVMLVLTSDEFFEPGAAKVLRQMVERLEALPQVTRVTWMDNAPPLNIFGLPEPVLPDHRASPARFVQAKTKALANPMIVGQFLSRDGKTAVLLLDIDWFFVRSDADCTTRIVEEAQSVIAGEADVSMEVAITGNMPMRLRIGEKNAENDRKFQYICYLGVLLMAAVLFRGLAAVIVSALPVAVGIFWAFGFIRFLDMQENPFNFVVVPVLLSMIGFTDSVHVIAQIRANRVLGLPARTATALALDQVGGACFLTSLTTAIGFASLWWAHHDLVREFGICCVVGAGVMFVSVVTTIPLACRTWLGRGIQKGDVTGWVERNFHRSLPLVQFCTRRYRLMSVVALVLTLATALMTLQLKPDERLFNGIPEDSSEAIALRHMDRAMGGLETSFVEATWSSEGEASDGAISNEAILKVSHEIEMVLKAEEKLGAPLGLAAIVNALPGEGSAVQKASLVELLPPPLKQVFWKPNSRRAVVVFRVQDIGIASYGDVFQRVSDALVEIEKANPGVTLKLEGTAVQRWRNLYRIIVDLARSLGTASIVIFFVLGVAYRSLRIGLMSIVPNLFPLAVTGAAMWLFGQPLELVSVLAFTVCLGIAVDDTIHFMNRYRDERATGEGNEQAIHATVLGVGPAMTMTTVVLLAGFATVLLSDSRDHHVFAMMGASTIAMAIVGDLLFLPALMVWFGGDKKEAS
jgi:predicted RND superfamily exporter protein